MDIFKSSVPDGYLRVGHYELMTDCLGPGTRSALWLQGCTAGCKGCIAPDLQTLDGGSLMSVDKLADMFEGCSGTEGITVSGGEPLYQADGLCRLLERIKRKDHSVVIYTGFLFEELKDSEDESIQRLLHGLADIIIDGKYIESLDDNKGLRGSSNQRIIYLTPKGEAYKDYYENACDRKNSFHIIGGKMSMTGIPSLASKKLIASLKGS